MVQFFSYVLAFFQLIAALLGIGVGSPGDIKYGGTPYAEPVITQWLTLIEDNASPYTIIYGAAATDSEKLAATELQSYLKQIGGTELPLASDAQATTGKEIIVGKTNREGSGFTIDRAALGDEGFVKRVIGDTLVIAGGEVRGTLYGVYSFLEEQLGCRWFTPELTVVPQKTKVAIDATLNDTQLPVFEYRDDYWSVVFDINWKAKHKLNSNQSSKQSEELGGGISYADFCHSMERMVPVSLFEAHPEYFSYREDEGKRTLDQRCLTNPEVLAITIENARKTLGDDKNQTSIMSITQNDNGGYCQCDTCKASDEYFGGPSGTNLDFVNKVADALGSEYPNVAFDTFAYQYTRPAPTNGKITARDNVIVRLCSIECCFAHPLADCGHERHEKLKDRLSEKPSSFAQDIRDWSKLCKRLYIWDYTTNFLMYLEPHPNFQVLSPNMQFFAENNVKGVFEQGNYTGGKSGEFGELRAYILAKLLWDPNADVEYHMTDFMNAYYGEKSAPYIREYIDRLANKVSKSTHLYCFKWHNENGYFTTLETAKFDSLWKQAKDSASDPTQLDNIRRSELSWRHHKSCMLAMEFFPLNPMRISENKKFYNDIIALGVTRLNEWDTMAQNPTFILRPVEWRSES